VTGPDDGVVQQGENVDISVDADDLQGVSTVKFEAADGTVTELTGESTYTADEVNVNTTGTATDRVIGTITATDTVGDTSTRTVSVDVVNPTADGGN
jgi:FlaG/FlaF family flagellin (archaellin)